MTPGPFTQYQLRDVLTEFDSTTEQRGRAYAKKGFAKVAVNTAVKVTGRCRNAQGRNYRCTVRIDDGDIYAECTCPVGEFCKHCVAVLITAANTPAPNTPAPNIPAAPSRHSLNSWRALVTELTAPDDRPVAGTEPPRPVALQVSHERSHRGGRTVTIRPVTTGKTGRWVVSRLTWRHLLSGLPDDPHDPGQLDLLTRIGKSLMSGFGYSPSVSDTISLSAAPTDFWELLRTAVDAGIELVPAVAPRQPAEIALTGEFATGLHVRRNGDDVLVDVEIRLAESVLPPDLPLLLGRPRTTGMAAMAGDVLYLGPVPPLSLTEYRLLQANESLHVPAADLDDFAAALPVLAGARPVEVDDGAVVPQVITGPSLVLQIDVADSRTAVVEWLLEYTVDDTPRTFTAFEPPEPASFRDLGGEAHLWDRARPDIEEVVVQAFPAWQAATTAMLQEMVSHPDHRGDIPELLALWRHITVPGDAAATVADMPSEFLRLPLDLVPLETALLCDQTVPGIVQRGVVDVRITGDADFRPAQQPPALLFTQGSVDDQTDWFDLTITVDVDGATVPLAELIAHLARGETHMVLDDGTYFSLGLAELDQLRLLLDEAREMGELVGDSVSSRTYNATLWEELLALGVVDDQLQDWQRRLAKLSQARPPQPVPPPPGLRAQLRPYQQDGLDWLTFLWDSELGGILADDMGLGKTVQTLALIAEATRQNPDARFLVVAPTSVVANWAAEAGKFVPGLPVVTVTSTAKRLKQTLAEVIGDATIVVTSYALLRIDYDNYAGIDWAGAIFDEGQFLKNHNSQVHQCARRLPAPFKLAITGTPMENRVMELWSLVSITAPGLFSSPKQFKEHFAGPIERGQAPERLGVLRRRLKPIMLRRTKDQVLTDLPPKQEQVVDLVLEPAHRKIYDTFLARERQQLLGLLDDFENNRIQVLRALTRLRQLSLHPGLVDDAHASVKSAKITYLAEQLPILIDEGHSALVFSSFTGFLRKLADRLDDDGIAHSYLDGSMSAAARAQQIEEFTSGATGAFLISLKAGGFGLNLTGADYCFMADPWWNPAAESQAVDRTHRIGQQRPVTVYRMVSEGTVEEKVIDLQNRKRELFSALIDDGAQFSGAITADDVRALLG